MKYSVNIEFIKYVGERKMAVKTNSSLIIVTN